MAFAATVIWQSRPRAGNANNGGGFDPVSGTPGFDYSQQNSAQVTYTDLVIGAINTSTLTSAAHPFTAAHVGNIINITGGTGFTVQRVQVLSVTATVATIDVSAGTVSSTGGTGYLGGALNNAEACAALMVSGNTFYEPAILGTFKLAKSRTIVRQAAKNAGDATYYETLMVDLAVQRAANELIRESNLAMRLDGLATSANTPEYATPTGFRCDRLVSAYLTGPNVIVRPSYFGIDPQGLYNRGAQDFTGYYGGGNERDTMKLVITSYQSVYDMHKANDLSGQPAFIGFSSDGGYRLYPCPDQAYVLNLSWSDLFTQWALGVPLTSFTNTAGVLSAVVVMDPSDNQGTTLSAAFSDSGGGTGATATATVTNGALASVAVGGSGGSGYSGLTKLLLGGDDSADVTFNLPNDYLYEVLTLGAPAFLQFTQPEAAYATVAGKAFKEYIAQTKGRLGGFGVQRIITRRR